MIKDVIDEARFKKTLGKYKGTIATTNTYVGSGGALGDPTVAQEQAPVLVTRMKDAGVTTVVLFTDVAMNKALMEQATAQEWFPEWFVTGAGYFDLPVLAQGYPDDQAEHTFGISLIPPYFDLPDDVDTSSPRPVPTTGSSAPTIGTTSGAVPGGLELVPQRHPQRRAEPDPEDLPAGALRRAGDRRTRPTARSSRCRATATPPGCRTRPTARARPTSHRCGWTRTRAASRSAAAPRYPTSRGTSTAGVATASGKWPKNLVWFDKSNSTHAARRAPAGRRAPDAPPPPCAQGQCPSTGATATDAGHTESPSGFVATAGLPNARRRRERGDEVAG